MHRTEVWEDGEDGNVSENPYYAGPAGPSGLSGSGDHNALGVNAYARMLRKQIYQIEDMRLKKGPKRDGGRSRVLLHELSKNHVPY